MLRAISCLSRCGSSVHLPAPIAHSRPGNLAVLLPRCYSLLLILELYVFALTFQHTFSRMGILRAGGTFLDQRIFQSGGYFQMIVEVVAVYFFVRCATNLARVIERRGDVLNYVSSSDPHWYRG